MVDPKVLLIALAIGLTYFVGEETIKGVKWVGREAKKGGTAIVHVLKKIPHP